MPITRRFFRGLNDRCVPEAEVDLGTLNVGYRESWPSDFFVQG
jgi:hypothetical protein